MAIKCPNCTKEKIKSHLKRGIENNGCISCPTLLPMIMEEGLFCHFGCHRTISEEEIYECEKELLKEFYGFDNTLKGKLKTIIFYELHDMKKTLRFVDRIIDEVNNYKDIKKE